MSKTKTAAAGREPLVRLVKRDDIPRGKAWAIRALAVVLALLTGALIVLALGHNPILVYKDMVLGLSLIHI